MAPPNQKWQSPMLPSFNDCLHAKNLRYQLIPSRNIDDQRILQSDCPDERNTWPHPTKSRSLRCYLPLINISMQKKLRLTQLTLPWDIDDQRILQSNWMRSTTGQPQPKWVVSNDTFTWWLTPCKKV